MYKIYLAGYIQGDKIKECSEWRKKIRDVYDNWETNYKKLGKDYAGMDDVRVVIKYPIEWLDPLNGKNLDKITGDGLKSEASPHSIVHRDYVAVTNANLIVVNMDTFGTERGLCGTLCELAWAWEHHIPIIMITDEKKYAEHPFLSYFASEIVSSVDELLEKKLINYFYKGLVNAEY